MDFGVCNPTRLEYQEVDQRRAFRRRFRCYVYLEGLQIGAFGGDRDAEAVAPSIFQSVRKHNRSERQSL